MRHTVGHLEVEKSSENLVRLGAECVYVDLAYNIFTHQKIHLCNETDFIYYQENPLSGAGESCWIVLVRVNIKTWIRIL